MFLRRERYEEMREQIRKLRQENNLLTESVKSWQQENQRLRQDLDYEHLENHRHHNTLLSIKKMCKTSYGTITALINFRKDVKKELDNCDID